MSAPLTLVFYLLNNLSQIHKRENKINKKVEMYQKQSTERGLSDTQGGSFDKNIIVLEFMCTVLKYLFLRFYVDNRLTTLLTRVCIFSCKKFPVHSAKLSDFGAHYLFDDSRVSPRGGESVQVRSPKSLTRLIFNIKSIVTETTYRTITFELPLPGPPNNKEFCSPKFGPVLPGKVELNVPVRRLISTQ